MHGRNHKYQPCCAREPFFFHVVHVTLAHKLAVNTDGTLIRIYDRRLLSLNHGRMNGSQIKRARANRDTIALNLQR